MIKKRRSNLFGRIVFLLSLFAYGNRFVIFLVQSVKAGIIPETAAGCGIEQRFALLNQRMRGRKPLFGDIAIYGDVQLFAEFVGKDDIRLDFTEDGVNKTLMLNLDTGKSNVREVI